MRKVLRNIARTNMRKEGHQHINRKVKGIDPATKLPCAMASFFATNWRDFC